jgi:two-component system, OmpR family, sensor histidine kinase KdpD
MTENDLRPEPDALLTEASRADRGRLKIFLGAAPGVGKTYAMLEAARRHRADGMDVLAAVIETHGRAETESVLRDLPVLPRRPIYYKGRILSEMDVDGLIARRPKLALIDELAHTNAPESRHEKRWQDVEEVLAAGIDVYTTLNIQHIETLNDTVTRITGVRVRETVPDDVLAAADEIELVDLPPEELLTRLREGKVYVPDQAARAVQNFFAKGNLTALRELAMRAAADQVDAQLREHMAANAIAGPWPAQERILVCINESPAARDAIRVAKRSAYRARAEWIALSVTSTKAEALSDDEKDRVAAALRLAERLGAELATLDAEHDVAQEILEFARRRNVRRIVLGRPRATGWLKRLSRENVSRDLLRKGTDFEITLTSEQDEKSPRELSFKRHLRLPSDLRPYGAALVGVAVATGVSAAIETLFPVASLSLIYMTAVVAVAVLYGLGPAIASAAMGFLAYNFLFTEPRFSFHVTRQGEFLTLILFLAASILTGNLAARLRSRVIAQRAVVDRTNKLYDFSRRVAVAANFDDVVWAAVSHVASTLECQSILLVPDVSAKLTIAGGFPPEDMLDPRDMSAASYSWDKGEPAGRGSGTLPTAHWLFLPVRTADLRLGVMGVAYEDDRSLAPGDRRLLEALTDQVALAIARIRLTEDLEATRLASETERLRTALLNSVSHDLRTPLVTIIGAAGSLAEQGQGLTDAGRTALAETIRDEGERLDRYVQNLLDMTRLGHGALKPNLVACDLADLIGSARQRLRGQLLDQKVQIDLADPMPAVRADPILTEQVLVNILDNAAKYAPDGTGIAITARVDGGLAILSVADEGPGIPAGAHDRVFDMFYRASTGDKERAGTGLGLAICKGLVEAQGGTIRAEPVHADGTGTRIVIRLPLDTAP